MKSNEAAEPVGWDLEELKSTLEEWQQIASQLLAALRETVEREGPENWRPHRWQIERALRHYRDLCRDQAQELGLWREDGLGPDEVYEAVWDEGDRLAEWLSRMTKD